MLSLCRFYQKWKSAKFISLKNIRPQRTGVYADAESKLFCQLTRTMAGI